MEAINLKKNPIVPKKPIKSIEKKKQTKTEYKVLNEDDTRNIESLDEKPMASKTGGYNLDDIDESKISQANNLKPI